MSKIKREVSIAASSRVGSSSNREASSTPVRTPYAARVGSEPLAYVLHDLQTPVAVLELSLALLDGDLASAQPDAHATLRDAQRAARRIREYIDHFVSSEIFGEAMRRRRRRKVELRALLKRIVEEATASSDATGVALDLDLPRRPVTCVRADEVLLERLFQNLLELFVADLGPGGRVAIGVRGGSVAEVRLRRGGVSERRANRDFAERLRGLVDPSDPYGDAARIGLPLGLRICQQVIEAHAGTLAVEEPPGGPPCLVVRVPAASL
jgi:K+-sensing histidine kinase KdpD